MSYQINLNDSIINRCHYLAEGDPLTVGDHHIFAHHIDYTAAYAQYPDELEPSSNLMPRRHKEAYDAVMQLLGTGRLGDARQVDLDNGDHRRALALALRVTDRGDDLEGLTPQERDLSLQLHEAWLQVQGRYSISLPREQDPSILNSMRLSLRMTTFIRQCNAALSILELVGIVRKNKQITKDDFTRLYPGDSFPAERIPLILNGELPLHEELRSQLFGRYALYIADGGAVAPPTDEAGMAPSPADTIGQMHDIAQVLEEMGSRKVPLKEKALAALKSYLSGLLDRDGVAKNKAAALPSGDDDTWRRAITPQLKQATRTIAQAVQIWSAWERTDAKRLHQGRRAVAEFNAAMEAMGIDDLRLETLRGYTTERISDILSDKVMVAHRRGVRGIVDLTDSYAQEGPTPSGAWTM